MQASGGGRRSGARRSDGKGLPNRSVPFYVPGKADDAGQYRRGSRRYASTGRSADGRRPRGAASPRALPDTAEVKPLHIGLVAGLAFALICVVALVGFVLASNADEGRGQAASKVTTATGLAATEARVLGEAGFSGSTGVAPGLPNHVYEVNPPDFLSIPATSSVQAVTLSANGVTTGQVAFDPQAINAVLGAIEEEGDCGFVFVDLDSGKGLAYNADKVMYIASAAKAPFVYWLTKAGGELSEYEREQVQWTIEDSDNESFEALFVQYLNDGYADFMEGHGVQHDDYSGDFYPRMNARSLASIWAEIYQFMRGGSDEAQWLAEIAGATSTSFIRDGLADTDAVVANKAGWIGEESEYYYGDDEYDGAIDYNSVSDAGIVQSDGHTYLMAIVTSQPDSTQAEVNVSALARALFNERASLQ